MASNDRIILKDNTVHYRLYPDLSLISDETTHGDHLKDYIVDCYKKLSDLLKDYFWHFEEFNLHPVSASSNQVVHIEGTTCYEDNVEDEWFIVYLLIKLTQLDPKLVISVEDADGQFLLIEAADHLPEWADPENTDHRVFIYNGEVHLISPSLIPLPKRIDDSSCININQALLMIRDEGKKTKCIEKIQYSIRRRITMFPMQITNQKHRAHCFVPSGVATLLNHQPNLISWAIRAFYHRDPTDLKACKSMKYFPPENRVKRNVTFTKCLYAQATSQRFSPDPAVGWNLPAKESPLFKSYDLGIKIACGFEMLVARVKVNNFANMPAASIISPDCCKEKRWINMVKSLEDKGYFKDNLQGSRRYKELLNKAYDFYKSSMDFSQDVMTSEEDIGLRILKILKTVSIDYDRLKREENSIEPEDNDDWMNINQKKLEDVLTSQFGNCKDLNENLAETIPEVFKSFINYDDAGIEGAEVPTTNGNSSDWKPNGSRDLEPVKFDEDKFGDALKNILSFRLPSTESSSSSSGMSDYEMEGATDSLDSDDNDIMRILKPNKRLNKTKKKAKRKKEGNKPADEPMDMMKQYMEAMDRELDETVVGKSFERETLSKTNEIKPFGPPIATCDEDEDLDTDNDDKPNLSPVDPELTALKNILESFDSQKGLPGPGSNLLSLMGVHLPRDSSSTSQS